MINLTTLFIVVLCLAIDANGSSNPCASADRQAPYNYIFRTQPNIQHTGYTTFSGWSAGGGQKFQIDTGAPFAGRFYASGDRGHIYGTRAYGSGYQYGATNTSTIAGRDFPYVAWPISFGAYLGGQELVGPGVDIMRPGGPLVTVQVGSTDTKKWSGLSKDEVYTMVGDKDSVEFMMQDLVWWCHATPQWPTLFNTSNPSVKPEQVIQYYRASSFALAYPYYNNTFAHGDVSTSFTFAQSTALPSNISSSSFLKCVNNTIGQALPIADPYATPPKPPSKASTIAFAVGLPIGIIGFYASFFIIVRLWTGHWPKLATKRAPRPVA